jgi:amino acid transporter
MTFNHSNPNAAPAVQVRERLTGRLSTTAVVFMVVAAAAPLSVVASTVPLGIAAGNGAAYPATYVVCVVPLLLFAIGLTAMARHVPHAGGFYTFIAHGMGRHSGLGAGYLALLSYTALQGAVYAYFGAVVKGFVSSHGGPDVPWYLYALAAMAAVGALGYRRIELSGKVLGALLICEVGIVLILDAAIIRRGGAEGFSTAALAPSAFATGAPGIALIFAITGYIGFEATIVFRDEVRDPDRTIPRATYTALLLIGGFYTLTSWAIVSAWGDTHAVQMATDNAQGMITSTASRYLGPAAGDLTQIFLITSIFAALLSLHNVLTRYVFAMGATDALPSRCGRTHRTHASPHVASLTQTASAAVLVAVSAAAGLDPVTEVFACMAGVSSVGVLALLTLTSAAVVVYFRRVDRARRRWHTVLAPSLGLLGLAVLLAMTAANLPLLVGGSDMLAGIIDTLLVGTFLGGIALAAVRRHAGRDEVAPWGVSP